MTSASLTTTEYNAALDSFFKRHYEEALPKFREVPEPPSSSLMRCRPRR
ncbi:hypothetical protein [Acrocarpospora macrocephala]|nr:hypothetical protein [Acrocarpospora macrocephala]